VAKGEKRRKENMGEHQSKNGGDKILEFDIFLFILNVDMSRADLLSHLLGVQMITSPRLTTPILTLWFVGLILVYYALFAILHKTIRDDRWLVLVIVLIFATAGLARFQTGFIARRFFYYYLVFAAGFMLARPGAVQRHLLDKLLTRRFFLVDKLALVVASILILIGYLVVLPVAYYAQKIYTQATRSWLGKTYLGSTST
jgi:hypothetical protein